MPPSQYHQYVHQPRTSLSLLFRVFNTNISLHGHEWLNLWLCSLNSAALLSLEVGVRKVGLKVPTLWSYMVGLSGDYLPFWIAAILNWFRHWFRWPARSHLINVTDILIIQEMPLSGTGDKSINVKIYRANTKTKYIFLVCHCIIVQFFYSLADFLLIFLRQEWWSLQL